MSRRVRHLLVSLAVVAAALPLALVFGGPRTPPPMASISDPFRKVSFTGLPALSRWQARDGARLAYRVYPAPYGTLKGSVVLVHGSSGNSAGMHVLGQALATAGYTAYALDIRGHGESGPRGGIDYIGQLEDDLEDFLRAVHPAHPLTLAGFSSGGGFALRVAGSARQRAFDNYLLLSPLLSRNAPTFRPDSGGWVRIGMPRILALSMLNALGVRAWNDLPVLRFAVDPKGAAGLTPEYSYNLAMAFEPQRDYRANIRAMGQPCRLVAGKADEVFRADRFEEVFRGEGKDVPVTLVPGIGHMALILAPSAVRGVVAQVKIMNSDPSNPTAR